MKVTLFFSYGISLQTWADTGLLQREIKLYQELIKRYSIKVQFLTYGDASDQYWEDELGAIKIFPVYERMYRPKSKLLRILQTIFIPWYFRNELRQTDLFKTNQLWGGWVAVLAKWFFRKQLLIRCGYENYKNSLQADNRGKRHIILKWVSLLVYRQASHILLNTREISNFIQRTFKVLPENITINSNWIDTNQFKLMKKNNGELNRVLFVGRFSREKNISLLFAALENTGIGIDLVGDGEQKLELIDIAKENNIDANFLGKFPNNSMPEIYNRYPVYILCSQYEGNPKTLLEAMACGSAVIGTNVSGIRDIISNDVNGLLVSEDSSDISNAIKKLLADESLRCKLGANARKAIMDNNSIEHYLNKEYDLYRRLLN